MAYTPGSFSADEVPTTAMWNLLWANDASFNNGTGIASLELGSVTTVKNDCKFSVSMAGAFSVNSTPARVPYDTRAYDTGSNVDITTNKGRFTAPISGFYHFSAAAAINNAGGSNASGIRLRKNGSTDMKLVSTVIPTTLTDSTAAVCADLQLFAGDYIEVFLNIGSGSFGVEPLAFQTYFDGFLVSNT